MAGVNFAVLIGNVGRDPEVRTLASGAKVAGFRLATNRVWKDRQTGDRKEHTEWHSIVVFGPGDGSSAGLVGVVDQFVRKGSKLYVKGALRTREWTDSQGTKRWTTEIVLSGFDAELVLLDSAGGGRPSLPEGEGAYESAGGADKPLGEALDDEIPF